MGNPFPACGQAQIGRPGPVCTAITGVRPARFIRSIRTISEQRADVSANGVGNPRHSSQRHVDRTGLYCTPKTLVEAVLASDGALRQAEGLTVMTGRSAECLSQSEDVTVTSHASLPLPWSYWCCEYF
jgi:hypothetical protein